MVSGAIWLLWAYQNSRLRIIHLKTLMLSGMHDVLVITTTEDQHQFGRIPGDWGGVWCYTQNIVITK